jgi:hypothetical protein
MGYLNHGTVRTQMADERLRDKRPTNVRARGREIYRKRLHRGNDNISSGSLIRLCLGQEIHGDGTHAQGESELGAPMGWCHHGITPSDTESLNSTQPARPSQKIGGSGTAGAALKGQIIDGRAVNSLKVTCWSKRATKGWKESPRRRFIPSVKMV